MRKVVPFVVILLMGSCSSDLDRFIMGDPPNMSLNSVSDFYACILDSDCPSGMVCDYYSRTGTYNIRAAGRQAIDAYMEAMRIGLCRWEDFDNVNTSKFIPACKSERYSGLCIPADVIPCLDKSAHLDITVCEDYCDKTGNPDCGCRWSVSGIPLCTSAADIISCVGGEPSCPDIPAENWTRDYGQMCGWFEPYASVSKLNNTTSTNNSSNTTTVPGWGYGMVLYPWTYMPPKIEDSLGGSLGGMCISLYNVANLVNQVYMGVATAVEHWGATEQHDGEVTQFLLSRYGDDEKGEVIEIQKLCEDINREFTSDASMQPTQSVMTIGGESYTLTELVRAGEFKVLPAVAPDADLEVPREPENVSGDAIVRVCKYALMPLNSGGNCGVTDSFVHTFSTPSTVISDKCEPNNEKWRYFVFKVCRSDEDCGAVSYSTGAQVNLARDFYGVSWESKDATSLDNSIKFMDMPYLENLRETNSLKCIKGFTSVQKLASGRRKNTGAVSPLIKDPSDHYTGWGICL